MPNRKTNPTSPGRRFATYPLREQLTATEPEKKLPQGPRKSAARNAKRGRLPRPRDVDGDKEYILAPAQLPVGDEVKSGPEADVKPGHAMALGAMPTGTIVHNVELIPGQGGKLGRAAGTAIQLVAKEGEMVTLRLPSSEMRLVRAECRATVGTLSNAEHPNK